MAPDTKRYVARMLIVYGIPFLIMAYAIKEGIGNPNILLFAAGWMLVSGLLTRGMR